MLHYIGVFADDKAASKALQRLAGEKDLHVKQLHEAESTPSSVAAVVASASHAEKALEAGAQSAAVQDILLQMVCAAIDAREGGSAANAKRVQEHAARFAEALGLDPHRRMTFERAALLRDVGKIHINNDVLLKKSVLTYDEWLLLHQHATLGANFLTSQHFEPEVVEIVRCHHECYDGDGYPDHLEGESIPYLARAMKIVDVYCAMTSPRHYRTGHSTHEQAIEYLRTERGKHYDPELLDVFIDSKVGQTTPSTGEAASG